MRHKRMGAARGFFASMGIRFIQPHRLLMLALFTALSLTWAGCVSEPEEPLRVRLGMPRDDLRFFFGEPLRIETVQTGGEVWYYRVISPNTPRMEGEAWQDPYTASGGVAMSVSPREKIREECPVFLSAEGRVIEPLPQVATRGK